MHPTLSVPAPPIHLTLHSRNAQENGTWHGLCTDLISVIPIMLDALAHDKKNFSICMFRFRDHHLHMSSNESHFVLLILYIFLLVLLCFADDVCSVHKMLIYIAVLEFICSQSPHSMKGLLIGLFYAIKGLYHVIAALLTVAFNFGLKFPLSGCIYHLVIIIFAVVSLHCHGLQESCEGRAVQHSSLCWRILLQHYAARATLAINITLAILSQSFLLQYFLESVCYSYLRTLLYAQWKYTICKCS